jgi:predicted dehydrogenase
MKKLKKCKPHGMPEPCEHCKWEQERHPILAKRAEREKNGTPGPWRVHGEQADVETETGIPICSMHREYGNGTTPVERDTNCYRIAAAPELEDAVRGLLDAYAPYADKSAEAHGEGSLHSSVRAARAVLAKIEKGRNR